MTSCLENQPRVDQDGGDGHGLVYSAAMLDARLADEELKQTWGYMFDQLLAAAMGWVTMRPSSRRDK